MRVDQNPADESVQVLDAAPIDKRARPQQEDDEIERALYGYTNGEGIAVPVTANEMRDSSGWGLILAPQARDYLELVRER